MSQLREKFGRRVRLGIVGGGLDSVIGEAHMVAMRVDGMFDLVAGVMSIDPDISRRSALRAGIDASRIYSSYHEMAEKEASRPDGIELVAIVTPPQTHLSIARAFLEKGIGVICEKPLARDVDEAREFLSDHEDDLFAVTHCFSGYPMVRQARAMIRDGVLGTVRVIDVEGALGGPDMLVEPDDASQRHWRFRPSSMGPAAILGEVSSHHHHIARFVTGDEITEVSALMTTITPRREVFDNAYINLRFASGAQGRIWTSYLAAGQDHGLWFRIFGEKGGLTWRQEDPEILWHHEPGTPMRRIVRGHDGLYPEAKDATRFPAGMPEGYGLAFANIYKDAALTYIGRKIGETYELAHLVPTARDGALGMAFIRASEESSADGAAWKKVAI